jgi:hypothetical protein
VRPLAPILALAALVGAASAYAHGVPEPLPQWGDCGADAARCQRAIGRADWTVTDCGPSPDGCLPPPGATRR